MNKATKYAVLFLCVILAATVIMAQAELCGYWDYQKNDWKYTMCINHPHVKRQKVKIPTSSPTSEEYPTLTSTEWEPLPYETMTPTARPYPTQETPEPYPNAQR